MTQNYKERLSMMAHLIRVSALAGALQQTSVELLKLVGKSLDIREDDMKNLFSGEYKPRMVASEFQRIQQLYHLALLMLSNPVKQPKQMEALYQFALNMGLYPYGTKRLLKAMMETENHLIQPEMVFHFFKEQHN